MSFGFSSLPCIVLGLLLPAFASGALIWTAQQVEVAAKMGDKEAIASFPFKNTGNTSVMIRDIHSGCECTVAELTKRTYAPGEEGAIKAVFTIGARSGRHDKMLTITTDDPSTPTVTLNLRVEIEELIALSTRMLRWKVGDIPTGNI
jgi:hypothetical protein